MDVFDLVAKITLDSSEYEQQVGQIAKDAETGSGWGGKVKSGLGSIAKAGGIAFGAIGAAATAAASVIGKTAIDGYAQYEQLVGGVDKLFGKTTAAEEFAKSIENDTNAIKKFQEANGLAIDGIIGPETMAAINSQYDSVTEVSSKASKLLQKNAQNAYKTAGMSANEYMETATSFSASLIQSVGNDTERAAQLADVAMQSMSDNVNTFGGDIESVKNAYQGFAKQNYTMLDNLNTMGASAA